MTSTLQPTTHGESCSCSRCLGFLKGNAVAEKFGTRSMLKLAPRAEQIADGLREVVPVRSPADDATIDALGMVLAQLERANLALSTVQVRELPKLQGGQDLGSDRDDLRRLSTDARGWANVALRYFDLLGLTPSSRARLGLDLARTQDTLASLAAAGAEIRVRRGIGSDE